MEGICGLFSFDHRVSDTSSHINKMIQTLSDGDVLKNNTLAGSHWAMASAGWDSKNWRAMTYTFQDEQLALVAVGDIFNFSVLADEFRISISEKGRILAENYRKNPETWGEKIHGNFAAIIFDIKDNNVVAAVDRLGIRQLCWLRQGDTIYFGSRINAIKAVCPDLNINKSAIYAFMNHEMIPAPMTIYKEVQKLEAGFELAVQPQNLNLRRYWDINSTPKFIDRTDDIAEKVYEKLNDAVGLMSNGAADPAKIGCFLSGGTDSSSIAGLMSRQHQDPVEAFSIGFPENGYDEMSYARIAAKKFGLKHHEFYTQPQDVLDALPGLVRSYDEPFGNSSIIPAYFCALEAKSKGVDYLLAGDGGDELFGGNDRYSAQQVFRNYFKTPSIVRKGMLEPLILNGLEKLPLSLFRKAGSYIRRANMSEVERIYSYKYVTDEEVFDPSLLGAEVIDPVSQIPKEHFDRMNEADVLDRHLYLDMKMTITDNDLIKVTHMTELAGIRVRYPMLDQQFVDYAFRIPSKLKLAGTNQLRYIFKQAFRELLPIEIINKPKHGFGLPIAEWLRNHKQIKELAMDLLFDSRHDQRGYFKKGFVENLWSMHLKDNTPYYGTLLWKFIVLEAWHRIHIEQETL
jgi:asparagine synthase (glutamine-hydrolysing)